MSAKHMRILCVMACFILVGAAGQQVPRRKSTIEEENGVKVIKNPKEPLYQKNILTFEEELTLGGSKAKGEYALSLIREGFADRSKTKSLLFFSLIKNKFVFNKLRIIFFRYHCSI